MITRETAIELLRTKSKVIIIDDDGKPLTREVAGFAPYNVIRSLPYHLIRRLKDSRKVAFYGSESTEAVILCHDGSYHKISEVYTDPKEVYTIIEANIRLQLDAVSKELGIKHGQY